MTLLPLLTFGLLFGLALRAGQKAAAGFVDFARAHFNTRKTSSTTRITAHRSSGLLVSPGPGVPSSRVVRVS